MSRAFGVFPGFPSALSLLCAVQKIGHLLLQSGIIKITCGVNRLKRARLVRWSSETCTVVHDAGAFRIFSVGDRNNQKVCFSSMSETPSAFQAL